MTPARRCSPAWPGGASRVVGVMGDPIAHSLSPLLHNAAFDHLGLDWVSVAFPVPAGAAGDALVGMRALGLAGLSVTMPHKEEALAAVDEASALARRLGAVNCVTPGPDGRLRGDATDGPGFLAALERGAGFTPAGRCCVVLGAGGAARAVVLALAEGGAAEVAVLNRTPARAEVAAALAGGVGRVGSAADVGRADLVVQATPVGMAALGPATLADLGVDLDALGPGQVAADLVYVPAETPFLAAARARGATPVGGLGMLVHQAALALGHWTGVEVDPGPLWDAARAVLGPDAGPGG